MKTWTLRQALPSDADSLSRCMKAAYGGYEARFPGQTLPPMAADYAEEIRLFPVWVAEIDGVVVAGLILTLEAECLRIANVAVHPEYQGVGLGKALLTLAEEEARRRGYAELCLSTHIDLAENISLYTHLGWSETGKEKGRVHMRKPIGQS